MVTQVTGSYADLYAWENLYSAWRKAARGKRGRGAAAAFEYRLEDNLLQLQEELATARYQPGAYASFTIHEPKRRLISAAPFRDRVVHHALCNVIEPAFERSFITHSYANRVGKGTHRALDLWSTSPKPTTCGRRIACACSPSPAPARRCQRRSRQGAPLSTAGGGLALDHPRPVQAQFRHGGGDGPAAGRLAEKDTARPGRAAHRAHRPVIVGIG